MIDKDGLVNFKILDKKIHIVFLMEDEHLRTQFLRLGAAVPKITPNEQRRVMATIDLVPRKWERIIDVGCGDGRLGNPLEMRGQIVTGLDWSSTSLEHCQFNRAVCDIRIAWPFIPIFDGAVCVEVLEHLPKEQVVQVLENITKYCRKGFVISVPARERLELNRIKCAVCGEVYHIWGHLHSFESFQDVDRFIGMQSIERKFITFQGVRRSVLIDRVRRRFGYYPLSGNTTCPFCGDQPKSHNYEVFTKIVFSALGKIEQVTGFMRPEIGWFVCRYKV